jgi:hypothetical protein
LSEHAVSEGRLLAQSKRSARSSARQRVETTMTARAPFAAREEFPPRQEN